MTLLDDRILEHLAEESWSSPSLMASTRYIEAPEGTIRDRCRLLADAELIAPIHRNAYEITTCGQLYLKGEIDVAHRPYPRKRTVRWRR
jgi:hypothetical protein